MTKVKRWLCETYLPAYCRDALTEENERLRADNAELRREGERLRAYINGMETAMRYQRRVTVRNEVGK